MKCLMQSNSLVRRGLVSVFFSTKTLAPTVAGDSLYDRIQVIRDPRASIIPVLNNWVRDGGTVTKHQLHSLLHLMRDYNRFNHALEISQWMTDRRYIPLTGNDAAVRLDLISKVHGIEHAERYFNNTSENLKTFHLYGALLNIYVQRNCVEKAEAIMQKMRELGLATTSFPFNMMINLYSHTGGHEKIDILMQEMENLGIPQDFFTLRNRMSACILASDLSGMEKILNRIEEDFSFHVDWGLYSLAASGYLKVGLTSKALAMPNKLESIMPRYRWSCAHQHLLSHYASAGLKDELYRIWNLSGHLNEEHVSIYCVMISSLGKVNDIEGAEKIYREWESKCTEYNFKVLNSLLAVYCSKRLFDKAELAVDRASLRGTPYARTWDVLAVGYAKDEQMEKAVEMLKRSLSVGRKGWQPRSIILDPCLEYLEGQGNLHGMKEIVVLLNNLDALTDDIYQRLTRLAAVKGQSTSDVLNLRKLNRGENRSVSIQSH